MFRKSLTLIIITGLVLALRHFTLSSAQPAPTLSLNPSPQTVNPGEAFTLSLDVTAVDDLAAFQTDILYDPALFAFVAATPSGYLGSTGRAVVALGPNLSLGQITLGAFSFGEQAGPSGDGALVSLTFTALSSGSGPITLSNIELTDPNSATLPVTPLSASLTVSSPTPDPTPTPAPPASTGSAALTFLGPATAAISTSVSVDILLDTPSEITGVDLVLNFDPQLLQIDSFTSNFLLPQTPLISFDNQAGQAVFSAVVDPGTPFTGSGSLATLTLTPKAAGNPSLNFAFTPGSKADTNVITATDGQDILSAPSPFSLTVTDQASLSLSLTTPSEDPLLGHTVTGTLTQIGTAGSPQLTTDPAGHTPPLDLDPSLIGQLTQFTFKVSGFLIKSFSLTVVSGLNTVNLGLLKAGDLNDDGIINSLDLALMYDQWFTLSPAEGFKPGPADFNRDGKVNSADHWHLLTNFLLEDE